MGDDVADVIQVYHSFNESLFDRRRSNRVTNPIDFVLPWVDGNDPAWLNQKAQYSGEEKASFVDASIARYRDWDNLQYWFRGVEKFAPWVNKVHFVTWGHLPKWLNTENPKLHIVNHRDFIPNEYLPVFSCRPIEINIHRIEGLSEDFVYFNDDCFILEELKPTLFFRKGVPCDTAALAVLDSENLVHASSKLLAMHIINKRFKKDDIYKHIWKWLNPHNGKEVIRTLLLMPWKFIPNVYTAHGPNAYTKSLFEEIWEQESELLYQTCMHRFRTSTDIIQHMFKAWQLCSGNFIPRKPLCKSFNLFNETETVMRIITERKIPMICLNDDNDFNDFGKVKEELLACFEHILPEKSSFEK